WLLLRLDVSGDPCSWCGDRLLLTQQLRLPPTSTLFPYTTLFRSAFPHLRLAETAGIGAVKFGFRHPETVKLQPIALHHQLAAVRSEEHTSELQSRENLVCRLLLEKKKKRGRGRHRHPTH